MGPIVDADRFYCAYEAPADNKFSLSGSAVHARVIFWEKACIRREQHPDKRQADLSPVNMAR